MKCEEHQIEECFHCKAKSIDDAFKEIDREAIAMQIGSSSMNHGVVSEYLKNERNHPDTRYIHNVIFGDECVIFYESLEEGSTNPSWLKRILTRGTQEIEDVYYNRMKRLAKEARKAEEENEIRQTKINKENARLI